MVILSSLYTEDVFFWTFYVFVGVINIQYYSLNNSHFERYVIMTVLVGVLIFLVTIASPHINQTRSQFCEECLEVTVSSSGPTAETHPNSLGV